MVEIVSDKLRCRCGHVRAHHSGRACWANVYCDCHGFRSLNEEKDDQMQGVGFTVFGRSVGVVEPREWHLRKQRVSGTFSDGHRFRGWAFGPLVVMREDHGA